MRPIRLSRSVCIPFVISIAVNVLAGPGLWASEFHPGSRPSKIQTVQIASPELARALERLERTRTGAPISRFIRKRVRRIYFFDPTSPLGRRYAPYDGIWDRHRKEIGIRNTLSGKATDYLVSVIAHEGSHAMNASSMAPRIAHASAAEDYVSLMIENEVRAYKNQIHVWRELRAHLSTFERFVWVDGGDVWMERVQKHFRKGKNRFRQWLGNDLKYTQSYRQYWIRRVQLVGQVEKRLSRQAARNSRGVLQSKPGLH